MMRNEPIEALWVPVSEIVLQRPRVVPVIGKLYKGSPRAQSKFEARMKKDEAKRLVLREWNDWAAKNVSPGQKARGTDGVIFFGYLQKQRPHLLEFKTSGDRWQIVHGWLSREGKIDRTMSA